MYTATRRRDQSAHNSMVLKGISILKNAGWQNHQIKADLVGCVQPDKIKHRITGEHYVPDVTSASSPYHAPANIIEVETADTLDNDHSFAQWQAFALYAEAVKATFFLVVPVGSKMAAMAGLRKAGLTNIPIIEV